MTGIVKVDEIQNNAGTTTLAKLDGNQLTGVLSPTGMRNRIINGDMRIDQRNNGASVTPVDNGFVVDRYKFEMSQASKFTAQQNQGGVTPPAGFTNYLGITSSSAYSVGTSEQFIFYQAIEGFNTADFGWGTSNAQTVTLSFRVYSSLTGTFGGALRNSAADRSYPFSYSIPSANTWTTVSITIPGDTTGTWLTTNGIGALVIFSLGTGATRSGTAGAWASGNFVSATGATSVVGTNGATFYITGVQLEAGSVATPFERRPYGTEEMLCKRYYQTYTNIPIPFNGNGNNGLNGWLSMVYPVVMRSAPTATGGTGSYKQSASSITMTSITAISTNAGFLDQIFATAATNPGYTAPTIVYLGSLALSAEL